MSLGKPVRRLLVLGNAYKSQVREEAARLLPYLSEQAEIVAFDLLQERDLSQLDADLALVLGGDGAILRAVRQMAYHQTPVLGVNLGKLGFLAALSPGEIPACFPRIVQGDYRIASHLMFECVVESPGRQTVLLGLNEIAFHTPPPFHMIELDLAVDDGPVSRFGGDGLILSTPVGSTAHSLSAGGPILNQELRAFVITPICPHTLTYRPLVDAADKQYQITLAPGTTEALLTVDGQQLLAISPDHRVIVREAPVSFLSVKIPGRSYYDVLREKLRWGTPPNYRSEA